MIEVNLLKGSGIEIMEASDKIGEVYKLSKRINSIILSDSFTNDEKQYDIVHLNSQIMALTQGLA